MKKQFSNSWWFCIVIANYGFFLRNANGFVVTSHHNRIRAVRQQNKLILPTQKYHSTILQTKNRNNNNEDENDEDELKYFLNNRLLRLDVLSIFISAQLLGLSDVLIDPSFWSNGGFFQPIPAVPSTLPTLVGRVCILSLSWILSCLKKRDNESLFQQNDIPSTLWTLADFSFFLVTLTFLMSSLQPPSIMDIVRQIWFTTLVVGTFRYLFSRLNIY